MTKTRKSLESLWIMDSPVRPEMVLKYLERDGVDDLGNPLARPMAHGRHKEIQSRVKHI